MSEIESLHSEEKINCKNCCFEFTGQFCPECGQKVITERNTIKHYVKLLISNLDLEKGLIYTAKMLFIKPGIIINDYIKGKTVKYYNPLKYMLLLAGFFAILMVGFKVFDTNIETSNEIIKGTAKTSEFQLKIIAFIKKYMSLMPILMIPFYSLVSKWVFRKPKLFYGEHLLINTYIYAQYIFFSIILVLILSPFPDYYNLQLPIGMLILLIYYTYATNRVFGNPMIISFLKSILIILFGMLLFMIIVITLSTLTFTILALLGLDIKEIVK